MTRKAFIKLTKAQIDTIINEIPESSKPFSRNIEDNIYYVNGILTDTTKADANINHIKKYFTGHKVTLIFNPTGGAKKDLEEAIKDYTWGISVSNNNVIPFSLPNRAALETLAILQLAKARNLPLGILASSQGSLITYNAIFAFAILSEDNLKYMKENVRVCQTGVVLPHFNINKIKSRVNKYISCVNKKDPVAKFVGLKAGAAVVALITSGFDFKYHNINWYLPVSQHTINYYDKKTDLDKYEPFVKKDFFIDPDLKIPSKWLEPFLTIAMDQ